MTDVVVKKAEEIIKSIEVCKEAFSSFIDKISSSEIPDILKN